MPGAGGWLLNTEHGHGHWHHHCGKQCGTVLSSGNGAYPSNNLAIPSLERLQREMPPCVLKSMICSRTFTANIHLNGGRQRNEPSPFSWWNTSQQLKRTNHISIGAWWRPCTRLAALSAVGLSLPHFFHWLLGFHILLVFLPPWWLLLTSLFRWIPEEEDLTFKNWHFHGSGLRPPIFSVLSS